jgi:hypothetical protein
MNRTRSYILCSSAAAAAIVFLSVWPVLADDRDRPAVPQDGPQSPPFAAQPAPAQPVAAPAPQTAINGVLVWLQAKVTATAAKSTPKQSQSISIDHGSTTLIDQSSGADLVSTALSLAPVNSGTSGGATGSGTVTASLYSVFALATKQDPLNPIIYNAHAGMRQLFFTLGREQQNSDTANTTPLSSGGVASKAISSTPSSTTAAPTPGTIYGAQWMIVNNRDASKIVKTKNDPVMGDLANLAQKDAGIAAHYTLEIWKILCKGKNFTVCENELTSTDAVASAMAKLTTDEQKQVDQIVQMYVADVNGADIDDAITVAIQELHNRAQFSLSFQTTQRAATLPNDYRAELVFDRGFSTDWLLTLNGSYDYSNSSAIGADVRTERGALQISRNLVNIGKSHLRTPLQFNLSGEGLHQETVWHYRAQMQLVIPIATGVDLPLSFGYGDQTDVLRQQEKGVYGKFGLTFDFGKLVDALHGQH